jgi:UPF0176 protein
MQNISQQMAVLSFYHFINIEEPANLIPQILFFGKRKYIRGTILIANEGFNGSISGAKENLLLLLAEIIKLTSALDVNVNVKIHNCDIHPFQKLKVSLKKEIISMNVGIIDVINLKGEYIEPSAWDDFIQREDVVLVDTRNDYEVEIGTFRGAINPNTETFKQFPKWVEDNREKLVGKKIAMCCTGGVRCEKSTAYLKQLGFSETYHLKGGILQYLEDTNNINNMWQGECFVFDDRRALSNDLSPAPGHWLARNQ